MFTCIVFKIVRESWVLWHILLFNANLLMVSCYRDEKHSHHPVLGTCKRECLGKWLGRGHSALLQPAGFSLCSASFPALNTSASAPYVCSFSSIHSVLFSVILSPFPFSLSLSPLTCICACTSTHTSEFSTVKSNECRF